MTTLCNYVDLSDHYVDLSEHVDLLDIKLTSRRQLEGGIYGNVEPPRVAVLCFKMAK